jgi:hypothetical protein
MDCQLYQSYYASAPRLKHNGLCWKTWTCLVGLVHGPKNYLDKIDSPKGSYPLFETDAYQSGLYQRKLSLVLFLSISLTLLLKKIMVHTQ